MITSRRLPHRRQSDRGRNCGAACLAMLLEHYKIRPSNLKEITSQVSDADRNGQPMCYNNLIAQYAQKRGSEDELAISDTILVFAKENSDVPVRYIPDGDNRFPFFECIGDKAICVLAPYTGQWIEVSKLLAAPTP